MHISYINDSIKAITFPFMQCCSLNNTVRNYFKFYKFYLGYGQSYNLFISSRLVARPTHLLRINLAGLALGSLSRGTNYYE